MRISCYLIPIRARTVLRGKMLCLAQKEVRSCVHCPRDSINRSIKNQYIYVENPERVTVAQKVEKLLSKHFHLILGSK